MTASPAPSTAAAITLLLLDVDGVLTDGTIILDEQGKESKRFFVRDGLAIRRWIDYGFSVAIISGRTSSAVDARAKELGISHVYQGIDDKVAAAESIIDDIGGSWSTTGAMGDDLQDLPLLAAVAWSAAPSDGATEVAATATLVTALGGGRGTVREAIEHLLSARGRSLTAEAEEASTTGA
jgi:3-deoxy-D-manno-octulosonate 8-phosphate phosphatase (KDO 8-P phosphatase)